MSQAASNATADDLRALEARLRRKQHLAEFRAAARTVRRPPRSTVACAMRLQFAGMTEAQYQAYKREYDAARAAGPAPREVGV